MLKKINILTNVLYLFKFFFFMQVIFSCKVDYSNKKKVRACLHLCRLKSFKFLFVFLQVIVVFDVLNSGGTPNTSFPFSGIYGVILVSYVPRHLSRPKKKTCFTFLYLCCSMQLLKKVTHWFYD